MHQKTAEYDFLGNRKHYEISQRRQAAWIHAIKRKDWSDKLTKYGRVCSRHFHSVSHEEIATIKIIFNLTHFN
ncbi:hypothetical protein JTB14_002054 [Gonioctena quinquepunctata]|nr:hypothetical protein JTB14_002054 [Gonioctena quinquepunctata]